VTRPGTAIERDDVGDPATARLRDERRHRRSVALHGHARRATYIYAIARPFHPVHLWGVRGVDDTAVHLVHHGELVAVVGTLSFRPTDDVTLDDRLETPGELKVIAQAHHAVVTTVLDHTVTLPLPLATIHRTEQRVVEMLRSGHERFGCALTRLDGRVEICVDIYGDGGDDVRSIGETLARLSLDRRYDRPGDPRLPAPTEPNILQAAYLVDATTVDSFVALARRLAVGVAATRVDITGPWPPYSFAEPVGP
jgi:hypothetical protein